MKLTARHRPAPLSSTGDAGGAGRSRPGWRSGPAPARRRRARRPSGRSRRNFGAGGVEEVVAVQRRRPRPVEFGQRGLRPVDVARAIGAVQAGDGRWACSVQQHVVEDQDLRPVGVRPQSAPRRGRRRWRPGVGTGRAAGGGAPRGSSSAVASAIAAWSQQRAVLVARAAPGAPWASKRAAARARCSRISASSPATSGSVGHQPVQQGGEPLGVVDQVAASGPRRRCWTGSPR